MGMTYISGGSRESDKRGGFMELSDSAPSGILPRKWGGGGGGLVHLPSLWGLQSWSVNNQSKPSSSISSRLEPHQPGPQGWGSLRTAGRWIRAYPRARAQPKLPFVLGSVFLTEGPGRIRWSRIKGQPRPPLWFCPVVYCLTQASKWSVKLAQSTQVDKCFCHFGEYVES